jgi:type VI secretion system protein ImpB
VQITYDVETGDAIEKRELPFIVGVLADLSGDQGKPPLKDRKFTEIDRDNFNEVLGSINPELNFRVDNKLTDDADDQLNVSLEFEDMDDFTPSEIVRQVEPLRKLFEARQRLSDLAAKLEGNAKLESLLQDILDNTEVQEEIRESLDANGDAADEDESDAA